MATMTLTRDPWTDWTASSLDQPMAEGAQYELLDGLLLVTPAPSLDHQQVVVKLIVLLQTACPSGLQVYVAPTDWRPDDRTSFQPDALVVPSQPRGAAKITVPLLLAVEVLSPSTRGKDLMLKRSKYEDEGVASYWVVDPDGPSVTVFELRGDRYETVAEVKAGETVRLERPFPVELTPSALRP